MTRKTWLLFALAFAIGTGCAGSCGKSTEDTSSQQSPQTGSTSTIHVPRESHPMRLLMDASAPQQ